MRILVLALVGLVGAVSFGRFGLGLGWGAPLVILALGGVALALTTLWTRAILVPMLAGVDAAQATARVELTYGLRRQLEREKQALLKAIKEVELDQQMRKLSEADARDMIERYRARALRILATLDEHEQGDFRALIERDVRDRLARTATDAATAPAADAAATPSTGAAPAPAADGDPTCVTCATRNDRDARFCKRCGTALPSA